MKENIIRIIEESYPMRELEGTDFRFVILLKPKEESTGIAKWEKYYSLTDTEKVMMADKNVLNEIRLDAATEVFRKFYQDTYLN